MNLSRIEQAIGHGRRTHRGAAEAGFKASPVQAINEVFDANTKRIAVVFGGLPILVFALPVLIAAASLAAAAHNPELGAKFGVGARVTVPSRSRQSKGDSAASRRAFLSPA